MRGVSVWEGVGGVSRESVGVFGGQGLILDPSWERPAAGEGRRTSSRAGLLMNLRVSCRPIMPPGSLVMFLEKPLQSTSVPAY